MLFFKIIMPLAATAMLSRVKHAARGRFKLTTGVQNHNALRQTQHPASKIKPRAHGSSSLQQIARNTSERKQNRRVNPVAQTKVPKTGRRRPTSSPHNIMTKADRVVSRNGLIMNRVRSASNPLPPPPLEVIPKRTYGIHGRHGHGWKRSEIDLVRGLANRFKKPDRSPSPTPTLSVREAWMKKGKELGLLDDSYKLPKGNAKAQSLSESQLSWSSAEEEIEGWDRLPFKVFNTNPELLRRICNDALRSPFAHAYFSEIKCAHPTNPELSVSLIELPERIKRKKRRKKSSKKQDRK